MFAKKIEDLVIYQIAFQLAKEVEELVKSIPHYWQNEDVKQIKRSSSSVPSNIAEGFSQRFYPKQFIHYLNIALTSSDETKNHLKKLCVGGFIQTIIANCYIKKYKDLSIKILNFISYLKKKHNISL
jgi:four helix bundle protein